MIPEQIYKLKQLVIKKLPKATLSHVLRDRGHDVQALICVTGIPITTCCHLAFWGTCSDNNFTMAHDKLTLSNDTIDKAVALLKPGATKIANQARVTMPGTSANPTHTPTVPNDSSPQHITK